MEANKPKRESKASNKIRQGSLAAAMTAVMTAVTCIGGFVKIPMPAPMVPITLQTFFACMAGVLLGARLGAISQLAYLVLGLVGVPVFSEGGGLMYVIKPTFGFLLGFPICAYVTGALLNVMRSKKWKEILIACTIGLVSAYLIGLPYLAFVMRFSLGKAWGASILIALNTLIYIVGDMITLVLLAVAAPQIIRRVPSLKSLKQGDKS